jgi:hypothetical protein
MFYSSKHPTQSKSIATCNGNSDYCRTNVGTSNNFLTSALCHFPTPTRAVRHTTKSNSPPPPINRQLAPMLFISHMFPEYQNSL